jgi:broad specificity phosphatase PhoE
MSQPLPSIYLARHGETLWTTTGQHTGRTDIPLTERGEQNARRLGERLRSVTFVRVLSSPLQRARRTAELAGFGASLEVDPDLMEWNYGDYEGVRSADIHQQRPEWNLFRDGCPNGETAEQVGVRADRVVARLRKETDNVLIFSHGHFLRVLVARWLELPARDARFFLLSTAALSILGYEHNRLDEPAIRLWNDDRHVTAAS